MYALIVFCSAVDQRGNNNYGAFYLYWNLTLCTILQKKRDGSRC